MDSLGLVLLLDGSRDRPILDKLSREYESDVVFLKTKANENVVLAKELGVVSVPTLIFINKDKEIEREGWLRSIH